MKDVAGNELRAGDRVFFLEPGTSSSWLVEGEVVGFTPKMVYVQYTGSRDQVRRSPMSVVRPLDTSDPAW